MYQNNKNTERWYNKKKIDEKVDAHKKYLRSKYMKLIH